MKGEDGVPKNIAPEVQLGRKSDYDIHSIFLNRWSSRALSGEGLTDNELMPLFEAARWAPSSYNGQLWRFLYAKKSSGEWQTFFDLLVEGNRVWAKNAAVLVVILSRKRFETRDRDSRTHSFEAGSAFENLALEGTRRGLVVHGMEGFDYERAREVLKVPNVFQVEAMVAIGKKGRKEDLPEKLQARERPNSRRPIEELVIQGVFHEKPE